MMSKMPLSNSNDNTLEDWNILSQSVLGSPEHLKKRLPTTPQLEGHIRKARHDVEDIIDLKDRRLLVVAGPCSIHDVKAAIEYGRRLKALRDELQDRLFIMMRVYFEKPRTTTGWKGLINDPLLNGSFDIEKGLYVARHLLLDLAGIGLPLATEALDPITPQYLHDLITWSVIGARTAESQTHREMASGLSSPVGIKNGTDGSLKVAINALQSVSHPHCFLGVTRDGRLAITRTRGNRHAHIILRGGDGKPNYDATSVAHCTQDLVHAGLPPIVMIDCSHANSRKDHNRQPEVVRDVARQIADGNDAIIGVMMESHLNPGRQDMNTDSALQYGVSITDACMGWSVTEQVIRELYERVALRVGTRQQRHAAQ